MPYADPEKRKAAQRESFRRRYAASDEMRKRESERKSEWLQTDAGKASNQTATTKHRQTAKTRQTPKKAV